MSLISRLKKLSTVKTHWQGAVRVALPWLRGRIRDLRSTVPTPALIGAAVVLVVLIGAQTWLSITLSNRALSVSESVANREIASAFADKLRGMGKPTAGAVLFQRVREFAAFNPGVRVYLIDEHGIIRASPESYGKAELPFVDIRPIKRATQRSRSSEVIYGDDPHELRKLRPISVAPIKIDGSPYYVYVVLGDGGVAKEFSSMLGRTLGIGTIVLSSLVVLTIVAVGLLFLYLRLRRINTSLAVISHDLRGPLSSVQGYLETLLERGNRLNDQDSKRYMAVALKSTQSISTLVNDLHHLSKLEASGGDVETEAFSLLDLLMDVVMSSQPAYDEKGLKLETEIPRCLPLVSGNVALVERLLRNLVENALRYTAPGGRVIINVEPVPSKIRITVRDDGCGIPADEISKLGKAFYRGEKTRHISPGSGLGLSIATRIAQAHGGALRLLSREGEGTAAIFELPQAVNTTKGERQAR